MLASCIADISHYDAPVDLKAAMGDGIQAVWIKATQGCTDSIGGGYVDSWCASYRGQASRIGLPYGLYHFCDGTDPIKQADHFLSAIGVTTCGPDSPPLCLDYERLAPGAGPMMVLDQLRACSQYLQSVTGVWPWIYGGEKLKADLGATCDETLAQSDCWFAGYVMESQLVWPKATWPQLKAWQYCGDGLGYGKKSVRGIGQCDLSHFYGTEDDLKRAFGGAST